ASDAYAICIQAGAIIAVFLIFFGRIKGMVRGIVGRDREGLRLFGNVVVAFIPAALIGLVLEDAIKQYLYGIWPVVGAWLVGGVFILVVMTRTAGQKGLGMEALTWRTAVLIGLAQVLSLWPGVSRSLVTIAGGLFVGLSVSAAVEFSFLLGLVTLGAATIYEGLKLGHLIINTFGWASPIIGLLAAAVSAFVAVRWMVGYLRTRSLAVFGWYRIAIGILVAALAFVGVVQ
ncbi:MAG: undecaprenyl-diphosphate phosphatase, partial [Spirochaetia bacterium]